MNLEKWLQRKSAATEAETEYNGFLSYAGEFHAATIGLTAGFAGGVVGSPLPAASVAATAFGLSVASGGLSRLKGRKVVAELRREPWYGAGAALVGTVGGWLASGRAVSGLVDVLGGLI